MEKKTPLDVTQAEGNAIIKALGLLPYNESAELISNLIKQFQEKNKPAEEINSEAVEAS